MRASRKEHACVFRVDHAFPSNWRKLAQYAEFEPRTVWSLSNAFTSAFKDLDPIPQFRATAKLESFFDSCFKPSF
jgi:hypothetical protein